MHAFDAAHILHTWLKLECGVKQFYMVFMYSPHLHPDTEELSIARLESSLLAETQ